MYVSGKQDNARDYMCRRDLCTSKLMRKYLDYEKREYESIDDKKLCSVNCQNSCYSLTSAVVKISNLSFFSELYTCELVLITTFYEKLLTHE